jgi:hypothetical protein
MQPTLNHSQSDRRNLNRLMAQLLWILTPSCCSTMLLKTICWSRQRV